MEFAQRLVVLASSRSPCSTWISTLGWLSEAVEKTWLLLVGMVVLRSISLVITPPRVSMPSLSGVTSSSSTSFTSPVSTPAWIAAPIATTSSGFTPLCGSFPKSFFTISCTAGMRVWPPTSTTSSISLGLRPASLSAWLHRLLGALDQVADQLLQLGARQRHRQMLRAAGVRGDEWQIDLGAHGAGELDLGLFGGLLQALQRHAVLAQVDALLAAELVGQPVDDALVEVVAAQVRVAVGALDLEDAVAQLRIEMSKVPPPRS